MTPVDDHNTQTPDHSVTSSTRRPLLWIGIAIVVLVAGGLCFYHRTYHLLTVHEGVLYRSGLQEFWQFENALRKTKPKTIVTLVDDREIADVEEKPQFRREIDTFAEGGRGITVERVPIKLGGWPEGDEVDRFLAITSDSQKRPVLVHCAQGVRRTGMMVAAYQMSVLGYDKERAKAELETFGHSERTVGDIKRFIDNYDPQTRRMTRSLPQSKE